MYQFAKRTRKGVDEANNPPFAVEIFFDHVEYNDFTKNSKQRRRFLQSLREDVASVLNLSDIQISILQLDAEQDMVVVQISPDPEGKDKWTPEQLAKRLSRMAFIRATWVLRICNGKRSTLRRRGSPRVLHRLDRRCANKPTISRLGLRHKSRGREA